MSPPPPAGRLLGVGVGPGDPDLMTARALRAIERAEVIAYHCARPGHSVARRIAADAIRPEHVEEALVFPVTTGSTDHPGGYEAALYEFHDYSARILAEHLDAGRDVAVLCEGDPFLYGSFMYVNDRLASRYKTEVVPGVTSFSAAAAAAGRPLARRDEVLSIVPGTLAPERLEAALRDSDAAVVIKLGSRFPSVLEAAERAGACERGIYVERASAPEQRVLSLRDVDGRVPYMSLVLLPSANGSRPVRGGGRVAVVGLGPAGPDWLTPQARRELEGAEQLVGYGPYLARVPARAGQRRHASDNREEAERARHALELGRAGARVAVVSSGDPGIFAMATAVMEALEEGGERYGDVEVEVVPGLSAMQAAAARVGAPLGHDFCAISLSDRLKPWEVVEERLVAAARADLVLALYNPASRARREQLERAREVLVESLGGERVVVVARAVGSAEESVVVTTLERLAAEEVDMRTLLIVGSSATRVVGSGPGARVYTPRAYEGALASDSRV